MSADSRKQDLRFFFGPIVDALGYTFSPDEDLVDFLLEQEVKLEEKHGVPFCPCQALTKDRVHNMRIVCPCIPFHRKHYDAMKRCWCGLYVHKGVTDPDALRQIPASAVS
jgi:ferredoxin-thioredoxin reductase catalytic chain